MDKSKRIKIIEVASNDKVIRIAGKMLNDFGAEVIRIGKA